MSSLISFTQIHQLLPFHYIYPIFSVCTRPPLPPSHTIFFLNHMNVRYQNHAHLPRNMSVYFLVMRTFSNIIIIQLTKSGNLTLIHFHYWIYSLCPNFAHCPKKVLYINFF